MTNIPALFDVNINLDIFAWVTASLFTMLFKFYVDVFTRITASMLTAFVDVDMDIFFSAIGTSKAVFFKDTGFFAVDVSLWASGGVGIARVNNAFPSAAQR